MKKILLSVQPEWVEKILNGEKTIEIRKTMPKCELPCEVFIYCSKGKKDYHLCKLYKDNKDPYYTYESYSGCELMPEPIDGKIVAKFILNDIEYCEDTSILNDEEYDLETVGLTSKEIQKYGKSVYAWHIDNLQIFDKPICLTEQKIFNSKTDIAIIKAPKSWCYCKYNF